MRACFLVLVALLTGAPSAAAHVQAAEAAELRAALLLNFARFTTWPDDGSEPSTPLVVGVVGEPSIVRPLELLARTELVHGRAIEVRRLDSAADLDELAVLYVGHDVRLADGESIAGPPGGGLLVVGERHDLIERGGTIELRIDGRATFRASREAARRAGLRLSSQLLRLAAVE